MTKKKMYFELPDLDHSADTLTEALGVSTERFEFLKKEMLFMNDQKKMKKLTQKVQHMLQYCESLEEVIFVMFNIAKIHIGSSVQGMPFPSGVLPEGFTGFIAKMLKDMDAEDDDDE